MYRFEEDDEQRRKQAGQPAPPVPTSNNAKMQPQTKSPSTAIPSYNQMGGSGAQQMQPPQTVSSVYDRDLSTGAPRGSMQYVGDSQVSGQYGQPDAAQPLPPGAPTPDNPYAGSDMLGEEQGPDFASMAEQALADLFAPKRDTAEEEAMMRAEADRQLQQQLGANRGRMGSMGMGMSGALNAQQFDLREQAMGGMLDDIFSRRDRAQDEYIGRIGMGLGEDRARTGQASDQAYRDEYTELLRDFFGEETGGGESSGGSLNPDLEDAGFDSVEPGSVETILDAAPQDDGSTLVVYRRADGSTVRVSVPPGVDPNSVVGGA